MRDKESMFILGIYKCLTIQKCLVLLSYWPCVSDKQFNTLVSIRKLIVMSYVELCDCVLSEKKSYVFYFEIDLIQD